MLTKKEFESYLDIIEEIKDIDYELYTPVADVVRGSSAVYPYTAHAVSVQGIRADERLVRRRQELVEQKAEIEALLERFPNNQLRKIARMRVKWGIKSWDRIAAEFQGRKSKDALRVSYGRALKELLN